MRRRDAAKRLASVVGGALAFTTLSAPLAVASGEDEAGLLAALARVPASGAALSSPISYVDYRAVAAARPGAVEPASIDDYLVRRGAEEPGAERWFAALLGISSGPPELLNQLLSDGTSWPDAVGFEFSDIDRAISFGAPPSLGTALFGDFDRAAMEAAYAKRGYSAAEAGEHTLLCGAAGCEAGMDVDLASIDARVPFGGRLGRQEPLAASGRELLSSPDIATVEDMLATSDVSQSSLADVNAYRALATSADDDLRIIQAQFLPGQLILGGPDVAALLGATPEQAAAMLAELDALPPLPPPLAVAIIDGATATEQVVTIALAYGSAPEADQAAEALVERLGTVRSIRRDEPIADVLAEHGVTDISATVHETDPGGTTVASVAIRAPLAGDEPDADGRLPISSALYRLFNDFLLSRDQLWLMPSVGPRA